MSFCQSTSSNYPQKIVIKKDTVIALTKDQITKINLLILQGESYKVLSDSMSKHISLLENKSDLQNKAIKVQDSIIGLNENSVKCLNQVVELQEKQIKIEKRKMLYYKITTIASITITAVILILK